MADDSKVWAKKDAMIVSQSSLKCATKIVMGLGASGLDKFTLENVKKRILETAESLTYWVYGQAEILTTPEVIPKKEAVLPTPTQAQNKILEAIANKIGGVVNDDLKSKVLEWAFKVHNIKKYPESMASVLTIVDWINK